MTASDIATFVTIAFIVLVVLGWIHTQRFIGGLLIFVAFFLIGAATMSVLFGIHIFWEWVL